MAKKNKGSLIGSWAFLIGVIIAVVLGLLGGLTQTLMFVLVVIGLIVGFLNIADEETTPFLLSGTALVIVSALGQDTLNIGGSMINNVLSALLAIFVPATVVVAIKNVFNIAKH
jgi:hypothetical protein